MATDTRFVVDQFALCNRFAALGTTKQENSLLPQSYGRVQTPFLKQNRKDTFGVAWGETNKTYTFPESLQVLASAYLRVVLPQNGSGNYKTIPGVQVIDKIYNSSYASLPLKSPVSLANGEMSSDSSDETMPIARGRD